MDFEQDKARILAGAYDRDVLRWLRSELVHLRSRTGELALGEHEEIVAERATQIVDELIAQMGR